MGDSDSTYNFEHIDRFVRKLEEGSELVVGNRFKGGVEKNAMPFLNKYVGNPVLSFIAKKLFNSEMVLFTMCFSKAFFGSNNPGVSTKIIWQSGLSFDEFLILRIPFVANLVVWTFLETIETFWPSKLFINVDFPTFGGPTK